MPVGYTLVKGFKGVRLNVDPASLVDEQFSLLPNVWQRTPGILTPRPSTISKFDPNETDRIAAMLVPGSTFNAGEGGEVPIASGMTIWQGPGNADPVPIVCDVTAGLMFGSAVDSSTYVNLRVYVQSSSSLLELTGNSGDGVTLPLGYRNVAARRPDFVFRDGKIYIFTGIDFFPPLGLGQGQGSGSGGNAIAVDADVISGVIPVLGRKIAYPILGWTSINLRPKTACDWQGVLVTGRYDGGEGSVSGARDLSAWIGFTDNADWETFVGLGKAVQVGAANEPVIAVRSTAVRGGSVAIEPYVAVFKRSSVWMMQGTPPTSTLSGALKISPILRSEGCISKETVVDTPRGLLWCSGKNVWLLPPGETPIAVGDNIAQYLRTLPQFEESNWHAAYWNGQYALSVPGTLGIPYVAHDSETITMSGGVNREQWWLDLRGYGDPDWRPEWTGPHTIFTDAMANSPDGSTLFGTWTMKRIDASTFARRVRMAGPLLQDDSVQFSVSVLAAGPKDVLAVDQTAAFAGLTEKKLQSTAAFVTRAFAFGDPLLEKIMEAWEAELRSQHLDAGALEVWTDEAAQATAAQPTLLTPNVSGMTIGAMLDQASTPVGNRWQNCAFYPANGSRLIFKTIQFRKFLRSAEEIRTFAVRVRPIGRRPTLTAR